MKRRILAFVLAIMMTVVLLAACGNGADDTPPADPAPAAQEEDDADPGDTADAPDTQVEAGSVSLTFWWFPLWEGLAPGDLDGRHDTWPLAMIDQFMAENPEVGEINFELLAWDTGVQALDIAVAANNAPNLCYIDLAWLPRYIAEDMVIPVNDFLQPGELEDFFESATDYATYNGSLYAFPILIAPRLFFANYTLLDEMGLAHLLPLTGDRSWTIDEFMEIASHFPIERDGRTIFATSISTAQAAWDQYLWFWNFGAELYDPTETYFTFNSPEGVAAVTFLYEMVEREIFHLHSGGALGLSFWAGETAFGIGMGNTVEAVRGIAERYTPEGEPVPEFVALQFPRGPGVENAFTYSGIGGLPVFRQATHCDDQVRAAMNFASFLTAGERNYIVKALGCFPVRRSAGDIYDGDENAAIVMSMLPFGRDLGRGENTNRVFLYVINPFLEEIYMGLTTIEQGLADMTAEANRILGE